LTEAARRQVGNVDVLQRHAGARDPVHCRARPPSLLPLQAGAGRDERVIRSSVGVRAVRAVASDRAVDETGVDLAEGRLVDPKAASNARLKRLEHDVGSCGVGQEGVALRGDSQVDDRAPLAAVPHAIADLVTYRVAVGRFDTCHVGAGVGEQHRCDRPRYPPREVKDLQASQWADAIRAAGGHRL